MGINYNIVESDFQRNNTSAYQLSILVGMDSLVYSICDSEENQLLVLRSYELNAKDSLEALETVLEADDYFGLLYRRVKIAIQVPQTALIPSRLYNDDEKATYLKELISNEDNELVGVDEIENLKLRLIYSHSKKELDLLKKKFPNSKIFCTATALINGFHSQLTKEVTDAVCLFFENDILHLLVFDRGDLQFYNSFPCKAASDVLYFTLLTIDQYGLNPTEVPVILSGQVVEDSEIYKLLYRYITKLTFLQTPDFVKFGKTSDSNNPNFLFHLHSLLLC